MKKRNVDITRYRIAILAFILGIAVIIVPYPYEESIEQLPQTGDIFRIDITLQADKSDIQIDDPSDGAQKINYTLDVKNNNECKRRALNAYILLDNSGSLNDYFDASQDAALLIIELMDFSRDKVGLIQVNETASVVRGLGTDKVALREDVFSLETKGATVLDEGIQLARMLIVEEGIESSSDFGIIIISDGLLANPGEESDIRSESIEQALLAQNAGIKIASVGIGDVIDIDLLTSIASLNGQLFFENPDRLDYLSLFSALTSDSTLASMNTLVTVDTAVFANMFNVSDISAGGKYSNDQLIWDLGTVQCQEEHELGFSADVYRNLDDLTYIDLMAYTQNLSGEISESNNVVTTIHSPKLEVELSDSRSYVYPGDQLNYIATITNRGSGDAYNVKAILEFQPDSFSIKESELSGFVSGNEVVWDNNEVGYDVAGTLQVEASSDSVQKFFIKGTVQLGEVASEKELLQVFSVETANGRVYKVSDSNTISEFEQIELIIEADEKELVHEGDIINYSISLTNNGERNVENIILTSNYDELYLTILSHGAAVDSGGMLSWNLSKLDPGQTTTLSYGARVGTLPEGLDFELVTSVSIDAKNAMIEEEASIIRHAMIVTPSPYVHVVAKDGFLSATENEEITVDKAVANDNEETAYSVVLTEEIPEAFDYVMNSASITNGYKGVYSQEGKTLYLSLGDMEKDEIVELSYQVIPNEEILDRNYIAESSLHWKDSQGSEFEKKSYTTIINYHEKEITADGEYVVENEGIGSLIEQGVFNSFFTSGEWVLYLKVLLGLVLAIPLPVMLMYGGHKEISFMLKQKKRTRRKPKEKLKRKKKMKRKS